MYSKIEKQDRVSILNGQYRGKLGKVIDVRGGDVVVVVLDGADEGLVFLRDEVERLLNYQVGDWIEFPDMGDMRSRGPILEISNGFASVGRWDVFSGKYIAHWNVYLANRGVRNTGAPAPRREHDVYEDLPEKMRSNVLTGGIRKMGKAPELAAPYGSIDRTLAERGARYGEFKDHALICQNIKAAFMAPAGWVKLAPDQKQALEVIADKIARMLNGDPNYIDNWHDIIGYAKLVENRLKQDPERALDTAIKNG